MTKIDVDDIQLNDIKLEDIAHALSNTCRWGGHCPRFYSVAQHCVHASQICKTAKLWALMHDAAEAYLTDLPLPIKERLPEYKRLEDEVLKKIALRFYLHWPMPGFIKNIDLVLYRTEIRDLFDDGFEWPPLAKITPWEHTIVPWCPEEARSRFIQTFHHLI